MLHRSSASTTLTRKLGRIFWSQANRALRVAPSTARLAQWVGMEPIERRLMMSAALPTMPVIDPAVVVTTSSLQSNSTPTATEFILADDQLDPISATHGSVTTTLDATTSDAPGGPGGCGCSMCRMANVEDEGQDEATFQSFIAANLPPGGGATTGITGVTLSNATPDGKVPYGADYRDNSEFMIGDVWVNVVLVDSNGQTDTQTENWTSTEIGQVKSEVIEALNWWEATFNVENPTLTGQLRFFADFTYADSPIPTKVEPINHKYSDQGLWIDDFLTATNHQTSSDIFTDVKKYNHNSRVAHNTDWAFTMFIVDSSTDSDGKFTDGYFGYAYFGGPFLMMTYDNSSWGISRMGQVAAHEIGHIFYAMDEYAGSNSYTQRSGYYNVQNTNAADGNPNSSLRENSIMAEASKQNIAYSNHTSSTPSLQMIGWRDGDSDGIIDVLDVPFSLTGSGSFNSTTNTYNFSGTSAVATLANQNPYGAKHNLTINNIDAIQYRLDGGAWATGNTYDAYSTSVSQSVSVTAAGSHTLDFRTIDLTTGATSSTWSGSFTVSGVVTPPATPAGITVAPTGGLTTTEAGGTANFTVKLDSQPTANVTIAISSSDTSEGTVNISSLTFTPANWSTPQTVTVTGLDDAMVDGNFAYSIITAAAVSTDSAYNGLNAANVSVSNLDNDVAGFNVLPVAGLVTGGLTTTEDGDTASFSVSLTSQPTANVTIPVSSSNTAEGTVSPSSLVFTPANWNVSQIVTITGVNDFIDDGDKVYTVTLGSTTSTDPTYSGLNPSDMTVTNIDDDEAGVTVTPSGGSGLTTSESGATGSFTVKLNSKPTANVTIAISSSNTAEGTVSVSSLIFTAANWNTAQTVTITGADDAAADGSKAYTIVTAAAVSADASYNGINAADVSVTNTDNDAPGVTVSPTSGLLTSEAGGSSFFSVVLNSQPTANVTIPISSTDTTEGTASVTSLLFTPANWNVAQTVTVTGVDDFTVDGNVIYAIAVGTTVSTDGNYNGINPADVTASNSDNDVATPAGITITPTAGLTTTEAGATASFTVVLNSQPTGNVTIAISSSDTTEGTVSASSLTFTPANWNVAQGITVTGVNDSVVDGNVVYAIVTGTAVSTDAGYNGINPADVSITNTDNDTAGFTITPSAGLVTNESGASASFTVKLKSQPTSSVTIAVASSNTAEGTVSVTSLTFTAANWNVAQTVTVTGVNDTAVDGNKAYSVTLAPGVSADPVYNGLNPADVQLTNNDNDGSVAPAVRIIPGTSSNTTEGGGKATFKVYLTTAPLGDVTVPLVSNNLAEGKLTISSLTFTPTNWNVAQTVTAVGVDDFVDDGNRSFTILSGLTSSTDPAYNGMNPPDLMLTNNDNDTAGASITVQGSAVTSEAGGAATLKIKLTSKPAANVVLSFNSSDTTEGAISITTLTFTPDNWNTTQFLTVTGVDDTISDGNVTYQIRALAIQSTDPIYNGIDPADVTLTNNDNDGGGAVAASTASRRIAGMFAASGKATARAAESALYDQQATAAIADAWIKSLATSAPAQQTDADSDTSPFAFNNDKPVAAWLNSTGLSVRLSEVMAA